MNKWNIPSWLEAEIRKRDTRCVYSGCAFSSSEKKRNPTWEHIINDAKIITRENIARCCFSCNASKGAKELLLWLDSEYCKKHDINKNTVAPVIRKAINALTQNI
jgi:hypothetical protein